MATRVMDIDLLRPLPEVGPLRAQEAFLGLVRAGPALVGRLSADAAQAGEVTRDLAAHLPRAVSPERFAEACRAAGVPERTPAGLALREVQEVFQREASRPRDRAPQVLVSVVLCTRHRREHLIR